MNALEDELRLKVKKWRLSSPEEQDSLVEQLRDKYQRQVTIVCTDMSGFSRVTKEEGILYFLANVKQMQGICVPIMQARGGTLFKVVADNLFVMFEDPVQAVSAAADCIEAVMAYSEGKTRNEQIRISVGVDTGLCWVLNDVIGHPVMSAFKLGEDVASVHDILVTEPVAAALSAAGGWLLEEATEEVDNEVYSFLRATRVANDGRGMDVAGHVATATAQPMFPQDAPTPFRVADMPDECVELLRAHMAQRMLPHRAADPVASNLDQARLQFAKRRAVVVMELHGQAQRVRQAGPMAFLSLLTEFKDLVGDIVREYRGVEVESIRSQLIAQVVGLFDSPDDALSAAVEAVFEVRRRLGNPVAVGIGYGEILDLDAMNCFGDEVNMAFKLGEDVARGLEILVTMPAWRAVQGTGSARYNVREASVTLSAVDIPYVSVQWEEEVNKLTQSMDEDITMSGLPWTRRESVLKPALTFRPASRPMSPAPHTDFLNP